MKTELTKEHAVVMDNFRSSEGRRLVSEKIEKLIADYEEEILSPSKDKNEVKYTEHDIYRMLRSCLITIKNEPERIISLFDGNKSPDYTSFI